MGIIPVRFLSTRLPGKPLIKVCGKELLVHVYEMAKKVKEFSEVYVATDDERIRLLCEKKGIKTIMTSTECSSGTDRICEALTNIEADYVINIQGDEPLFEPENISKIIKYHIANKTVDVINVMTKIYDNSEVMNNSVVKVAHNNDNDLIYLSRSPVPGSKDSSNRIYYKHCGVYGLTREALVFFGNQDKGRIEKIEDIEMFRFIENGKIVKIIEIETESIGVDTPEDVRAVEAKMKRNEKI